MITVRPEEIVEIQTASDKYSPRAGDVFVDELNVAWTDNTGTPHEAPLVSTKYAFAYLDTTLGPSQLVVIPFERVLSVRTTRPREAEEAE